MTQEEIVELFTEEVQKKDFGKRAGILKNKVWNYRNRPPKLGYMLEILIKLDLVKITKK
jgi:hypothetical protein